MPNLVPTPATRALAQRMILRTRDVGADAILEHVPNLAPDQSLALLAYVTKLATNRPLPAVVTRRSKFTQPECGTESGYQWHRYNDPDNWPLPANDPCGCRAAHRRTYHERRKVA